MSYGGYGYGGGYSSSGGYGYGGYGGYSYGCCGSNSGYTIVLVLYILLVIIGIASTKC
ncbi:sporulation protein YjcZ [Mycoplasmatota bacterium]|nr:sporulation protein YjcZ [Mycoplasmatota bacterium]